MRILAALVIECTPTPEVRMTQPLLQQPRCSQTGKNGDAPCPR